MLNVGLLNVKFYGKRKALLYGRSPSVRPSATVMMGFLFLKNSSA